MRSGWSRPRRVAAALALVASLACSAASRDLDAANELRHDGKPREALKAYQDVLAELGEGPLGRSDTRIRLRALQYAADVSYLEIGDYTGAVAYYRRIISLHPSTEDAWKARAAIGDIFRDRFQDHVAAIAQYADIAASSSPSAAEYQLKVAREYLEIRNYEQARTEARILRERWPESALADEAQLLTAQAWALEKRTDEALGAFQATIDRKPRPDVLALALEGEAHLYAQLGKLDKAIELYTQALPSHPNPEAVRTNIEKVRQRRKAAETVKPGDRDAVFDRHPARPPTTQEIP